MSHIYRQYQRIVSKWPVDRNKTYERNFKHFLERDVQRLCGQAEADEYRAGAQQVPYFLPNHNANFKALEDLIENQHSKRWPTKFTHGALGLNLKQLQEVNSEPFRSKVGLGKSRWSWLMRIFKPK